MSKLGRIAELVKAREEDEKGFTLIELIIVIAIIGILVAIAIPVYGAIQSNARQKAVDAAAKDTAVAIVAALSDDDPATTAASVVAAYNADSDGKIVVAVADDTANPMVVTSTYTDHDEEGEAQASY